MPDFSFPNWMLQQNTFADSLLKGAQVGAIVANNRYRNQALAAQAIDAERNYALREKEIAVRDAQQQAVAQARFDELEDMKTLSGWKPEQPLPSTLRTMKSLSMADNIQNIYSKSKAGRTIAAAEKDYHERIEELLPKDALRVRDMLDQSGHMTAEIADFIEQAPKREKQFTPSALEKDLNYMLEKGYITPEAASTLATEKFLGPTETLDVSTDEQGRPVVRVIKGRAPQTAAGGPTTAVRTDVQKRIIGFEKSLGMSQKLLSVLKPENVGVAGWMHEVAVDQGLAQIFPELASKQNVSARTLLRIFNETMLRTLKADSQLNKAEEQRILSALPKTGANESLPSATAKIEQAMEELRGFARADTKAIGQSVPQWAMSPEEIRAEVGKSLTPEQALELIKRNYPNFNPNAR